MEARTHLDDLHWFTVDHHVSLTLTYTHTHILVGGFNPSEKYEFVSGIIIPNIRKVIKIMFQTTNQYIYTYMYIYIDMYIYICITIYIYMSSIHANVISLSNPNHHAKAWPKPWLWGPQSWSVRKLVALEEGNVIFLSFAKSILELWLMNDLYIIYIYIYMYHKWVHNLIPIVI